MHIKSEYFFYKASGVSWMLLFYPKNFLQSVMIAFVKAKLNIREYGGIIILGIKEEKVEVGEQWAK